MSSSSRLEEFYNAISADLTRTMHFWFEHSHDSKYGGFLHCLDPSGVVYDDTKYIWMQARQVWMYARLYNEEEEYRTDTVLQAAVNGADFIQKYAKNPKTGKCCFSVTRDGRPIKIQRTIFSECFYTMAMSEMFRATHTIKYKTEATEMFDRIVHWVMVDPTDMMLESSPLSGTAPVNSLAVPMMLLCMLDQLEIMDAALSDKYSDVAKWSLEQTLAHRQRGNTVILENVSPSGEELPGSRGRLTVPGHAVEAGWFLLQYASKRNDDTLKQIALRDFIVNMFNFGWDKEYGGILYFLDVDKFSPVQLEWNMKLWWTHNEAMIAFLMAYQETRDITMLDMFAKVFDYCYSKHVDKTNGEWLGYLNRDGTVSLNFKGGPWKGCFHVPRALLMCKQMLQNLLNKN